jgi:hypothetical protein
MVTDPWNKEKGVTSLARHADLSPDWKHHVTIICKYSVTISDTRLFKTMIVALAQMLQPKFESMNVAVKWS